MTAHTRHPLDSPWRRLLAGVLVVCVALAAVPALAHCCADRCHDAEPVTEPADGCDCSLTGVEPPVDILSYTPEPIADLVCTGDRVTVEDDVPSIGHTTEVAAAAIPPTADRTVVLLI